jgi:2-oxoglutarate ferredoxin oxidoreductase subunit alpha
MECAYASHGDTKHLLLFPKDPAECFELSVKAFDFAERFQTPVFVMSDLDIGMNDWVVPELEWDDSFKPDRGRVLDAADLAKMDRYFRYTPEDADFVAARTLPGVDSKGATFIRGSGHDRFGTYTETPALYQEVVDRLAKKHAAAAAHLPEPVVERRAGATVGVVCVGSPDLAVREALDVLADAGINADYMRIKSFPFAASVSEFLDEHEIVFVVEQNRDAQLRSLLTIETSVNQEKLHSVLVYGGFPVSAQHVIDGITSQLEV